MPSAFEEDMCSHDATEQVNPLVDTLDFCGFVDPAGEGFEFLSPVMCQVY